MKVIVRVHRGQKGHLYETKRSGLFIGFEIRQGRLGENILVMSVVRGLWMNHPSVGKVLEVSSVNAYVSLGI